MRIVCFVAVMMAATMLLADDTVLERIADGSECTISPVVTVPDGFYWVSTTNMPNAETVCVGLFKQQKLNLFRFTDLNGNVYNDLDIGQLVTRIRVTVTNEHQHRLKEHAQNLEDLGMLWRALKQS